MKKYKEYKDETPERTINLIRSILTDLDLLLLDSNANCDNIFACRVILINNECNNIEDVSVSAMLPLFFKQEYLALSSKKDESRNSFPPYSRSLQGTFA